MSRIFITCDNKIIKDNFNNLPMGRDILNKNIWFYDDKIIHYTRIVEQKIICLNTNYNTFYHLDIKEDKYYLTDEFGILGKNFYLLSNNFKETDNLLKLLFNIKKKMANIFFKDVYKKDIKLIESIIDKDIFNKYRFYYI